MHRYHGQSPCRHCTPGHGRRAAPPRETYEDSYDDSADTLQVELREAPHRQDIGKIFVQFFENQVGMWMGQPASLCVFAETCGNALALEHNGDLYTCDHYVYPEYRLGNVMDRDLGEMAWSAQAETFGNDKRDTLTAQCQRCQFRFACNGGCPKHRILRSKDGEAGHNYFCESYTMFFRHAGPKLREMAATLAVG